MRSFNELDIRFRLAIDNKVYLEKWGEILLIFLRKTTEAEVSRALRGMQSGAMAVAR
jgi:hypothetical protein